MNNKFLSFIIVLFFGGSLILTSSSCNKDDDDGGGDPQELITTVVLTFTDDNGNVEVYTSKDTDGLGGNAPVIDEVLLLANSNYTLVVEFMDESDAANVEDITTEVQAEAEAHLICFETQGSMPNPMIQDKDGNGDPLGLESTLTTGTTGSGNITVILKHEPDKGFTLPCDTGETDVETTFEVMVL